MKISIRGINSFLVATRGVMSQEELVELTRQFLDYRGVSVERLVIEFCWGEIRHRNTVLLGLFFHGQNRVRVYLGDHRKARQAVSIGGSLFHELDHVVWKAQGRSFNHSLPWPYRPHERRAQGAARLFPYFLSWLRRSPTLSGPFFISTKLGLV